MRQDTKAVIYMLISALSFTLMSVAIKSIPGIPLFEKIFFRNLVSCIVAGVFLITSKRGFFIESKNRLPLFGRSILGFMGIIFNFYAVQHLTLADSNMIAKLAPITVSICAVIFLKEKVDMTQVLGIILSFIGALFVIKPSLSLSVLPSLSALTSVCFAGMAYTLVRFLKNENSNIIVFYFSLLSVILSFPMTFATYITPEPKQWIYLLSIGVCACFGQFFLTYSYKNAPASEVAIYNYSGIPFGIILGFMFFGEIPDLYSLMGGIIIIAVAVFLYFHAKNKRVD